jgi:hypothetical protein
VPEINVPEKGLTASVPAHAKMSLRDVSYTFDNR